MEQRLSVITLGVADLDRSRRFYQSGLGWVASSASQDGVIFFQLGGLVLALYPRPALAADAGLPDTPVAGFAGITLAYNVRSRDAVADILAVAVKAGGSLLKPAQDVFWGGHSGYFADPDGHIWEVVWNPFWTLDGDGSVLLPNQ